MQDERGRFRRGAQAPRPFVSNQQRGFAMNVAESLAREIRRVAELRRHYEEVGRMPRVNVAPAMAMMDMALEKACVAAGSNDDVAVLRAHEDLKGFEK